MKKLLLLVSACLLPLLSPVLAADAKFDADQFLEQFEINFSIVYDSEGALAKSFDVTGMPTSYLYDRDGQLIGSHIGFKKMDIGKLETAIANAINNQES